MDISQKDRDSLRAKQHKLVASFCIGNIVEHNIQDPVKYKRISRQEQGLSADVPPELPKINYQSKYMDCQKTFPSANDNLPLSTDMAPIVTNPASNIVAEDISLSDVASNKQTDFWLNMDRIEFEKLEWMSEKAEEALREKLRATTHFDQEGRAIAPYATSAIDRDNQAHDIGSLIKLLDSTFQPQITYSLNVISKIATRAATGVYDAVFDENIYQVLIKECLLRVRRHVDSANETVCIAALRCLRMLICNTVVDEVFMDKMCNLFAGELDATIWLSKAHGEFDIELKDNECVQEDAIIALITRTDLLKRLLYLLKTKCDSEFRQAYQDCIIDILIRVARHSRGTCWMLNSEGFPSILSDQLLPTAITTKSNLEISLAMRTIKFIRIIAFAAIELGTLSSHDPSLQLTLTIQIERKLTEYYHIDCYDQDLKSSGLILRFNIETLRLMRCLSSLPKFSGSIFNLTTMDQEFMIRNLKIISRLDSTQDINAPSSLDWQYATALIELIGGMIDYEKYHLRSHLTLSKWNMYIVPIVMQWWTDILRNKLVPHQDVSITIASGLKHFDASQIDLICNQAPPTSKYPDRKSERPRILTYYSQLIADAVSNSSLNTIHETDGRLRDPVMLPSFGFLNLNNGKEFGFSLNKVAGIKTSFILLKAVTELLHRARPVLLEAFEHDDITTSLGLYLKNATKYFTYQSNYESSAQKSLLAQQEVSILSKSLLMLVEHYLDPSVDGTLIVDEDQRKAAKNRIDSYSNILLDAVSLIGLINLDSETMGNLKDSLIDRVILEPEIHKGLLSERLRSREIRGLNSKIGYLIRNHEREECFRINLVKSQDLHILKSVYMSTEETGRFWLFQPFIDYYKALLRDDKKPAEFNENEDGTDKWFANYMVGGSTEYFKSICSDLDVIGAILKLNASLMLSSTSFVDSVVRPNIEELICLLGIVFLDSELFLSELVSRPLKLNLEFMLSNCLPKDGLFREASCTIRTLNITLADFFNKLVEQYEASSYGDVNFSNFLLLFISPYSDSLFKKKLFSEKLETCLSQMRLAHEEVWIPRDIMEARSESDPEIRSLIKLAGPYLSETNFLRSYRNKCLAMWEEKV